jgi:hypothetical protein
MNTSAKKITSTRTRENDGARRERSDRNEE